MQTPAYTDYPERIVCDARNASAKASGAEGVWEQKKRDMYLRYVSLRQDRSGRDTDQRSMSLSSLSCYRPEASPIASSSRSAVTAKSTTASTASWKKSSVMFS